MRTHFLFAIVLGSLTLPAAAQDAAQERTSATARSPSGAQQRDSDTNSSKFLEYRDIPQGGVAALPAFRGQEGRPALGPPAADVTQKDQRYFLRFGNEHVVR